MKLFKQYPIASDRMGMIWTLNGIDDACIIEFGPAGTTHFSIEGLMQFGVDIKAKTFTTHLDEHDVTFGDEERLIEAIKEVDEIEKPKYIFVLGSSITSIIGIDLESVKFQIQDEVQSKIIILPDCDFQSDFRRGIEDTLLLLVKEISQRQEAKEKEKMYNIIGIGIHDYNQASDVHEIKRMMKECFGFDLNTTFMLGTTTKEIENASRATLNIVVRKEGLKAAEELKRVYNQPYIYVAPYGIEATSNMIKDIGRILDLRPVIKDEIEKINLKEVSMRRRIQALANRTIKIKSNDSATYFLEEYLVSLGFEINKDKEPIIIFSNGVDVLDDRKTIQIEHPSFGQEFTYPYTPLMGFRGADYFLQVLSNKITEINYKTKK